MEAFLVLAKGARGAACAQLISDALSAPGVFVFAELLDEKSVQDLATQPAHAAYVRLLQLFAYGTYADYVAEQAALPALNARQTQKLQQLSIITLAQTIKTIPYTTLQPALGITTVRELEDLVIDAIYLGLLDGKLDQRRQCLRVESAMGRDLQPGQAAALQATLSKWLDTSSTILAAIDEQISRVVASDMAYLQERESFDKAMESAKAAAQKSITVRAGLSDADGAFDFYDDPLKRAGGSKRSLRKDRKH